MEVALVFEVKADAVITLTLVNPIQTWSEEHIGKLLCEYLAEHPELGLKWRLIEARGQL